MAIHAPQVRKYLTADALFDLLRTGFAAIADHRSGDTDISLTDALLSAFAMFSLKSPSLLAFDKERTEGLDHSVGHLRIFAADFEVRAAARPRPKSLHTLNAVSDQKTAPLLWFRQSG
jgi:hypothetical protein